MPPGPRRAGQRATPHFVPNSVRAACRGLGCVQVWCSVGLCSAFPCVGACLPGVGVAWAGTRVGVGCLGIFPGALNCVLDKTKEMEERGAVSGALQRPESGRVATLPTACL